MSSHNSAPESNDAHPVQRTHPDEMDAIEGDPGDTQVVSQSVYDSLIRQNGESMYQDSSLNGANGATLMTLHEGDSGHLDLLAEFDTARHERNQSQANDEESIYGQSPSSPIADHGLQPEFFPESQRFLTTTPATAIKKNQTPGKSQTPSASRNPLLADIGSSGGLLMGLSQAFKNTQAPSSPLVHGLQSELASDRPSPNVPIQQRIHNPVSSPLMNFPGHFARESSEPNLNYISLKESQNNRDKSLGERLTRSEENIHSGDQIDQDFYQEPPFLKAARRQREIDEEAAAQFAALNAPERLQSEAGASSPANSIHIHEDDALGMERAGSEEETEQEEDAGPQVPQSQEAPPSSMEEDKENYISPHEAVIDTSSAHDRLSQALGIEGSQPGTENSTETAQQGLDDLNDPDNQFVARSSQIMVKDSQQTPQASPPQDNARSGLRTVPEEMDIDTEIHVTRTSPVRQRLESSPPGSRPATRHSQDLHRNSQGRSPRASHHNEVEDTETQSTNPNQPDSSRNESDILPRGGSLHQRTGSGLGEKSSSMPSQIKETPIHLRPSVGDAAQITKIPNTSPEHPESHRWEGESNENNEDDDLPPMFPVASALRFSQQRPSQTRAQSSPIKGRPSILSSPSGRQRRRLMEIASDTSPQVHSKVADFDMSFFANDPDFNALIQGSPTRPRKRRRGNLGQSFNTSDTTVSATPRPQPPKIISSIQEITSPARTQSSADVQVPTTVVRNHSGPPRRANENVWEIESSPQQVMPRRSRSRRKLSSSSQHRPQTPEPPTRALVENIENQAEIQHDIQPDQPQIQAEKQLPNKSFARPIVLIDNSQRSASAPSSQLTELDIGSDDLLPSDNPPASAPSSPQPPPVGVDERQIAPSQIIALWADRKRAYYPGTCFGTPLGVSETKYSVKLEDSAPVEVNKSAVKRLELRIGDGVKVDMPGVPKVTHIVRGFEDKLSRDQLDEAADRGDYPQTDIFGYSTLILGPKQRKSLPNGGLNNSENVIRAPIGRIYLDTILWNQLKDREFTYEHKTAPPEESVPQTPMKSSLPTSASPSARFSRNTQGVGLFSNMAFAVSYKEDDGSKKRMMELLAENGGTILHKGFAELFETSSILPITTPTKGQHKEKRSILPGLHLTDEARNVGFTCVIADTHTRREKYMQALALNLPCLSGRWVEDCVNKGRLLDWDVYLLPAGDSMYLNGATRSRIMAPTPPAKARLAQTISARPRLLAEKSVLIVMGRGKAEQKRKAYIFLTFALGASRVERVPDLETARALLDSQSEGGLPSTWDFVCVDDADQDAAKAMMAPRPTTQRINLVNGKKRKSSATFTMDDSDTNSTTKVVGNEFVCQSLILGRLFEE